MPSGTPMAAPAPDDMTSTKKGAGNVGQDQKTGELRTSTELTQRIDTAVGDISGGVRDE